MSRMSKRPLNLRIQGVTTKLKSVQTDSQQVLNKQDELPQYYILAVPYNCDINDPFLKVASVNVNQFRQKMLPNRESILMNPQLKYLSYQKRMKLVQPPPSFVQQVFNSLLQKINIQLAISKQQKFQKEVERNQEKLKSRADIDTLMKMGLDEKEHQQNRQIEYQHIYNIEGKQILKFQDISNTCRLLFVSQQKLKTPPKILGLEGYINNLPEVKKDAVTDLFKRIQKQWANRMKDQYLAPQGLDFEDELSSQAPTQFFSPAFQLKENIEINEAQICKILLKKVDQNSKIKPGVQKKALKLRVHLKQKHDQIQNALIQRFQNKIIQQKQKRNAQASSSIKSQPNNNLTGQESGTTIGKATFFNQEPIQIKDPNNNISNLNTKITNEGILQEASLKITKEILKPRFTRQEIQRRGLFQPSKGKFKLTRTLAWNVHKKSSEKRSFSPKNNLVNDSISKQYAHSIATDQSMQNNTKRSVIKISKGKFNGSTTSSQTQDQKFMKANELKEICSKFNLKRKDVFNIKSEFYSIVQMYENSLQGRRKNEGKIVSSHFDKSKLQLGQGQQDQIRTFQTPGQDSFIDSVPLDFFIKSVSFFKFMASPTLMRVLVAIGIDIQNPKFKVSHINYVELYCIMQLGNLSHQHLVDFWMKFFDPQGLGKIERVKFLEIVEQLVRGNSLPEPSTATMQYGEIFQQKLTSFGCIRQNFIDLQKFRQSLISEDINIALLTNMIAANAKFNYQNDKEEKSQPSN